MQQRALVIGIGGQDGSYLAEILLAQGFQVFGTSRRCSIDNLTRIAHIKDKITKLYRVELTDTLSIMKAVDDCVPHHIYHVADQDKVGWSYDTPEYSVDVTAGGVSRLLACVQTLKSTAKVYIPISATIYGDTPFPQDEGSAVNPLSPYACAKEHAFSLARYYRQCYGMDVNTVTLYNHTSPRQGLDYLLSHIYHQAYQLKDGVIDKIRLGSLDLRVDIGYAREFMQAVVKLMHLPTCGDVVLGTGTGYKIGDIARYYCARLGITCVSDKLEEDPNYKYPGPRQELVANPALACSLIGWRPKYDAMKMFDILDGGDDL